MTRHDGAPTDTYSWCPHCHRVWLRTARQARRGACLTPRCPGSALDLEPWRRDTEPRRSHPEYPDEPEIGACYPPGDHQIRPGAPDGPRWAEVGSERRGATLTWRALVVRRREDTRATPGWETSVEEIARWTQVGICARALRRTIVAGAWPPVLIAAELRTMAILLTAGPSGPTPAQRRLANRLQVTADPTSYLEARAAAAEVGAIATAIDAACAGIFADLVDALGQHARQFPVWTAPFGSALPHPLVPPGAGVTERLPVAVRGAIGAVLAGQLSAVDLLVTIDREAACLDAALFAWDDALETEQPRRDRAELAWRIRIAHILVDYLRHRGDAPAISRN